MSGGVILVAGKFWYFSHTCRLTLNHQFVELQKHKIRLRISVRKFVFLSGEAPTVLIIYKKKRIYTGLYTAVWKSSLNSLVLFTCIATVNKQMYIDVRRPFKDAAWRKRPEKMDSKQLVSTSRQCSSTTVGFGRGFLDKEQCDNTRASPALAPAYFYMSPRLKSTWNGRRFRDAMKSLRMRRKSWKGFHRIASRNVSNTFTVVGRNV